ncbi:MAG: GldG family protein, partial [Chthoniobacterales bacterium]|nr:GldG family protein [Chthoniobacterales bacterium]
MNQKNSHLHPLLSLWLNPSLAILSLLILLVALNALLAPIQLRFDLTADRRYSFSQGTKQILSRIQRPIQARLYLASSSGPIPPLLKFQAKKAEELLREMAIASKGKIEVQILNPTPDSEAEDSARLDGITPQPLPNGESITLGISFTSLDRKATIEFLAPERERLLEYDFARSISQILSDKRPTIGILSPLPVLGYNIPQFFQPQQAPQPWLIAEEIRRYYNLRNIPSDSTERLNDINVLLVIHPKGITPETEYALDQFLLRGGKIIALLDPYCLLDSSPGPLGPLPSSSNLPTLLKAWGFDFNTSQIIADLNYMGQTQEGRAPWLLNLDSNALSHENPISADLSTLLLAYAGTLTGTPPESL